MEFAKRQMEKYGWSEGKGLGKHEDGIQTAIKPNLKFNNYGVGHDAGAEFTNRWWENVYNNALNNVDVKREGEDSKVSLKSGEMTEITTRASSLKSQKGTDLPEYGNFLKTSVSWGSNIYDCVRLPGVLEIMTGAKQSIILNDESLFNACGGRTAHKGARHGLKLSGKLSRLEKQEKALLKQLKNITLSDQKDVIEKKVKKITKYRNSRDETSFRHVLGTPCLEDDSESSCNSTTRKKKKKKCQRNVSFSETVTEYRVEGTTSNQDDADNSNVNTVVAVEAPIKDENQSKSDRLGIGRNSMKGYEKIYNRKMSMKSQHKIENFTFLQHMSKKKHRAHRRNKKSSKEVDKSNISSRKFLGVCTTCNKRKYLDADSTDDELLKRDKCSDEISNRRRKKAKDFSGETSSISVIAEVLNQSCKISNE